MSFYETLNFHYHCYLFYLLFFFFASFYLQLLNRALAEIKIDLIHLENCELSNLCVFLLEIISYLQPKWLTGNG